MIISQDTPLREIAFIVCTALDGIGVTAVLTGGAAATIWSGGQHQSHDCDFVIKFHEAGAPAEAVLLDLGYVESGGVYRHRNNPFTLEFPPGPLSVGDTLITTWDTLRENERLLHILSSTDSCRDRLAAFFHWADYSSLKVAVAIAKLGGVNLDAVRQWSLNESTDERYAQFARALAAELPKS